MMKFDSETRRAVTLGAEYGGRRLTMGQNQTHFFLDSDI